LIFITLGVQNDSRMNVSLALTSMYYGAIITNYTKVTELIKNDEGKVKGAIIEDCLTGKKIPVRAKTVINAAGPFCDLIRKMDDQKVVPMVSPSAGTHIILPNYFSPQNMGLIDPSTSDGRVLFFLPWEGNVISGTTDAPSELTFTPKAGEGEIEFILKEINGYITDDVSVRRSDVLAAWSGIRPLVKDPKAEKGSTESLVRNHLITTSDSGLITIAGGKWTTYRNMAKETIDFAVEYANLNPARPKADTSTCLLIGAHGYSDTTYLKLVQQFGIETDVAKHLARSYGDRSVLVAELCQDTCQRWPLHGKRLHHLYPYDEAEVIYACHQEHAQTAVDVLARRTRLAFLSVQAARDALPRVIELMAKELNWTKAECENQKKETEKFLESMGLHEVLPNRSQFTKDEIHQLHSKFDQFKHQNQITTDQAQSILNNLLPDLSLNDSKKIIERVDADRSGKLNFTDFLEVVAVAKYKIEKK
jgi:glycerol-3-phosphate dehydrogenase